MAHEPDLLEAAERIAEMLSEQGIGVIVIGEAALAAHRYVRYTEDIDLGVNIAVRDFAFLADRLRTAGFDVALREPDGQDPLGGVIDVSGPVGLVQIVNFGERFPAAIESGLSKVDIVELLRRNPAADRDHIRGMCRQYRLRGLEPLIREADNL